MCQMRHILFLYLDFGDESLNNINNKNKLHLMHLAHLNKNSY